MTIRLPEPRLTRIYRLEAELGEPVDVGDVSAGRRRIVPLTGGTFSGPELNGKLLPVGPWTHVSTIPYQGATGHFPQTLFVLGGADQLGRD